MPDDCDIMPFLSDARNCRLITRQRRTFQKPFQTKLISLVLPLKFVPLANSDFTAGGQASGKALFIRHRYECTFVGNSPYLVIRVAQAGTWRSSCRNRQLDSQSFRRSRTGSHAIKTAQGGSRLLQARRCQVGDEGREYLYL